MRAAGYERSDYRLVALGYASPFPEGRWFRYPEDGWSRLTEGGCPVWDADADWAADRATVDLAGMLRDAAAVTGAEFLDLADAFDGHQLCDRRSRRVGAEGPSPLTAEWFRRLSFGQGSTRESLHPNAYGQRVMGACLALLFDRPRGDYACADTPGQYLDGIHLRARPRFRRRVGRSRHQLDAVAAGGRGECAGPAPVFAAALDLEAVLLEAGEGGVELGDDDGHVGPGRDDGVGLVHEVDLGAGAFEPGEGAVGGIGNLGEAEDGEEFDGAVQVGGGNLDTGVLEHQDLFGGGIRGASEQQRDYGCRDDDRGGPKRSTRRSCGCRGRRRGRRRGS